MGHGLYHIPTILGPRRFPANIFEVGVGTPKKDSLYAFPRLRSGQVPKIIEGLVRDYLVTFVTGASPSSPRFRPGLLQEAALCRPQLHDDNLHIRERIYLIRF